MKQRGSKSADRSARCGITLIEVLIVIAIIGMLIQLALPAVQAAREAGRRTQCASNIRQMGFAMHIIEGAYKKLPQAAGYWPLEKGPFQEKHKDRPLWDVNDPATILTKEPPANFSTAMYFLLPYMEEKPLYMQFKGSTQGYDEIPSPPFDKDGQWSKNARAPAVQLCPTDDSTRGLVRFNKKWVGVSNYPVNIQALGHYLEGQPTPDKKRRLSVDFPDGTSKTVLFAERYAICRSVRHGRNAWLGTYVYVKNGAAPYDPFFGVNDRKGQPVIQAPQDAPEMEQCNPRMLQGNHPGTMNIVLADGSTKGISPNINEETWKYLVLPSDGKTLGDDW